MSCAPFCAACTTSQFHLPKRRVDAIGERAVVGGKLYAGGRRTVLRATQSFQLLRLTFPQLETTEPSTARRSASAGARIKIPLAIANEIVHM